jgi:epoxide hydrolase-like predicted phosphatase
MIKAVIFDVGGVLVRTHNHQYRRDWEKRLGLDEWESEKIVFGMGDDMGTRAQSGAITDKDLWEWVGNHLQLSQEELKQFRSDFWAGDTLDEELVRYIRSLRPHYQTAIISNATDRLRRTLSNDYPITDAFDLIVCSAEEQVMKPAPEIYWLTLDRLGRKPQEAVFIDDSEANVRSAKEVGMSTIHYQAGVDVVSELAALGVTPDAGERAMKERHDERTDEKEP